MKLHTLAIVAVVVALSGCGGQSAPPSYPANAAPATAVIVDTDLAGLHLSVQDGDQVIAMMDGRHYTKVPIRPGAHTFSAGTGRRSEGGGTVPVDVQPGQTIYLQVGGVSSGPGAPIAPGFATNIGRAEGAFGQGGISLIPQASGEFLIQQSTEQQPVPVS
jgi:ABC-type Fe3+-hydroxamate transport system substrate-binding protein